MIPFLFPFSRGVLFPLVALDKIYDKSRAVDILYLDFRKAFDKVPHKRLMAKVKSLGIIDEVNDLDRRLAE